MEFVRSGKIWEGCWQTEGQALMGLDLEVPRIRSSLRGALGSLLRSGSRASDVVPLDSLPHMH